MGSSGGSDASSLAEFLFGAAAVGGDRSLSPPVVTLTSHAANMTSDAIHCMEAMAAASRGSAQSSAAGAALSASIAASSAAAEAASAAASAHMVWSLGHQAATTMAAADSSTSHAGTMHPQAAALGASSSARRTVVAAPAAAYSHAERILTVPRVVPFHSHGRNPAPYHGSCEQQPSQVDHPKKCRSEILLWCYLKSYFLVMVWKVWLMFVAIMLFQLFVSRAHLVHSQLRGTNQGPFRIGLAVGAIGRPSVEEGTTTLEEVRIGHSSLQHCWSANGYPNSLPLR